MSLFPDSEIVGIKNMDNIKCVLCELYEKLPIRYSYISGDGHNNSFHDFISNNLRAFISKISEIDTNTLNHLLKNSKEMNGTATKQRLLNALQYIIGEYVGIYDFAYRGNWVKASDKLLSLMRGRGKRNAYFMDNYYNYISASIKAEKLYRVVDFDNSVTPNCNHVPFEKRGLATANRFSFNSYPALYLCNSLEDACYEVGNIKKNRTRYYSEFTPKKDLKIRILNIPKTKDICNKDEYDLFCSIIHYPTIFMCSIYNDSDKIHHFHDEYLFGQVLFSSLFLIDSDEKIYTDGLAYSSVHNSEITNYVFPAYQPQKGKLIIEGTSPFISELFNISEPQKLYEKS